MHYMSKTMNNATRDELNNYTVSRDTVEYEQSKQFAFTAANQSSKGLQS